MWYTGIYSVSMSKCKRSLATQNLVQIVKNNSEMTEIELLTQAKIFHIKGTWSLILI